MKIFYAAVTDLFFMTKISSTAKAVGAQVVFTDSYEHLIEKIEDRPPSAVIVDLNSFLTLAHIEHIKSRFDVNIIGYLSHAQIDLQKNARKVCNEVYPQSELSDNLVKILS